MPSAADLSAILSRLGIGRASRASEIDAAFRVHDCHHRRHQAIWGTALGLLCYMGLLGVDWFVVPDVAFLNASLRLLVGLPVGLLAIWTLTRPDFPPLVYEVVPGLFGIICAITIGVVMSRSAEPAALAYFCAGLVVLCFTINLVGLNPPMAAAVCGIVAVVMAWLSNGSRFGSTAVSCTYLVFGLMVGGVATYANWRLLTQRRHTFVLRTQDQRRLGQIERHRDLLQRLATVDDLTDLLNRRGFEAMVASDLARIAPGTPLAALMIDIDCFKAFNDGYGHPSGDDALRLVAEALRSVCGSGARLGRIGGEEFGIVVYDLSEQSLQSFGERLRAQVEACAVPHRWSVVIPVVTVTIGMAAGLSREGQSDCAPLLLLADKALYAAKRAGRNRVMLDTAS